MFTSPASNDLPDHPDELPQILLLRASKSAIEWIMERYQITNNPNDWTKEVGNPRYILDLLLSVKM